MQEQAGFGTQAGPGSHLPLKQILPQLSVHLVALGGRGLGTDAEGCPLICSIVQGPWDMWRGPTGPQHFLGAQTEPQSPGLTGTCKSHMFWLWKIRVSQLEVRLLRGGEMPPRLLHWKDFSPPYLVRKVKAARR